MSTPHSRSSTMSISTASPSPSPSHIMKRQDSGYESLRSSSRRSRKPSSHGSPRRRPRAYTATTATSTSTSVTTTTTLTTRTVAATATAAAAASTGAAGSPVCFTTTISHRYSASRTCFSHTFPSLSCSQTPAHSTRASSPSSPWQSTTPSTCISTPASRQSVDQHRAPLFPFAPIDLSRLRADLCNDEDDEDRNDEDDEARAQKGPTQPPPATTHYWTSDSTRRLEYAEIDAASRGVAGWLRRRLRISLPACFTGREKHLAFDDDSGSVRRYRLSLEEEEE